jgi:hypothetical protein
VIWHAVFLAADPDAEIAAAADEVALLQQAAECALEDVCGRGRYEPDAQQRFHAALELRDSATSALEQLEPYAAWIVHPLSHERPPSVFAVGTAESAPSTVALAAIAEPELADLPF